MSDRYELRRLRRTTDGVTGYAASVETLHARGLWPDPAGPGEPPLLTSPYASRHGAIADVASLGVETIATITALMREAIERAQPKPDTVSVVWRVEPLDPRSVAIIEQVVRIEPLVAITRLGVGVSWDHGRGADGVSIFAAVVVPPIEDSANPRP